MFAEHANALVTFAAEFALQTLRVLLDALAAVVPDVALEVALVVEGVAAGVADMVGALRHSFLIARQLVSN